MGEIWLALVSRKPVFGVSVKASFKPVSSATENSKKFGISPITSWHMILSKLQIKKALIRHRNCEVDLNKDCFWIFIFNRDIY